MNALVVDAEEIATARKILYNHALHYVGAKESVPADKVAQGSWTKQVLVELIKS